MITVQNHTIRVETKTQTACFEKGFLTSLRAKATGEEFLPQAHAQGSALQLCYGPQGAVDVIGSLASTVSTHPLSPRAAQFRFSGWDADGVLTISEDPNTGDVLVEPSAYSSRPGVLSCRWRVRGFDPRLDLVAPFFQGVRLKPTDPLLQRRWFWPQFWEAGLAILQGPDSGFWIHCQDDRYRYKALHIAEGELGFETEAYGPIDGSLGAGGLVWRLNVYQGDWRVPASRYRDWLWRAYALHLEEERRKPWARDIRLALSWYRGDLDLLDALARRIDPHKVLIHFSQWRTDNYDENYPSYVPSQHACEVFAKANAMGFHVMPHCNSVDMDPTHPAYHYLRDFQYRDVQTKRLLGWAWDSATGRALGVPNAYHSLTENRHRKVMVKIHPALAMWRSVLAENIRGAVEAVGTDAVFIDVTLCSHNLHNCLVENTTPTEGMKRLIHQIGELGEGLAVGGEGLNEITFQGLSFAQAHLFLSWHDTVEGLERTGGCPLNYFLFGRLCRTFGYSRLSGKSETEALRMRVHASLGAIPTVTVHSADEIDTPNDAVLPPLERAINTLVIVFSSAALLAADSEKSERRAWRLSSLLILLI
ncbi:MAG: DUF6259 domain-containing protein, partial [Armatimonadota bacterium]|nr:DUF6259 domain-containing protein [Armatimonadota bacterium]